MIIYLFNIITSCKACDNKLFSWYICRWKYECEKKQSDIEDAAGSAFRYKDFTGVSSTLLFLFFIFCAKIREINNGADVKMSNELFSKI